MGIELGSLHDHWKIPDVVDHHPVTPTEEDCRQFMGLSLKMQEAYMRHNLYYHAPHGVEDRDQIVVGFYIEDTIYARLYYRYGGPGMAGDRAVHSKNLEGLVARLAPQTVLILVKTAPEVIARRMHENPHPYPVVREEDIERVCRLFEAAFEASILKNKIVLDTSQATIEETMTVFAEQIQSFLTEADKRRIPTG